VKGLADGQEPISGYSSYGRIAPLALKSQICAGFAGLKSTRAGVAELADATDSKSTIRPSIGTAKQGISDDTDECLGALLGVVTPENDPELFSVLAAWSDLDPAIRSALSTLARSARPAEARAGIVGG
jgi:hypothetical protein